MENTSNTIETRTSSVWLGADNIIRIIKKPGCEENLEDAKEVIAAITEISKDKTYPSLVNFRGLKSQDEEAQKFYADWFTEKQGNACALIIGAFDNQALAKGFVEDKHPTTPTKVFRTEDSALTWLRGFLRPEV